MSSDRTRNALIGVLSAVIGVLLLVLGVMLGVALSDDEGGATAGSPVAPQPAASDATSEAAFDLLEEIYAILQDDFVDPQFIDRELLFEGAINGMFEALGDPHSTYIDPTTWSIEGGSFSGTFDGIGATVARQDDYVVIVAPIAGTPAERAGLMTGDAILEVDGEPAQGWSVEKAVLKIRGRRGTEVELLIRHTDGVEERVTLVRAEVFVASVTPNPPGGVLRDAEGAEVDDLAYLYVRQFTALTPNELSDAIDTIHAGGARGLILDLRGNAGGLLAETAQVADMFLDSGLILIQVDRDGREAIIDARRGMVTDLPIVIVQDEFSASGAELLSAALAENGRATIVGSRSFGKGTVNHAVQLSNGGAVYVSIARWLTPARNQIEGLGVKPDVEVVLTADDIEQSRDVALHRAIEVLRAQLGGSDAAEEPGEADSASPSQGTSPERQPSLAPAG